MKYSASCLFCLSVLVFFMVVPSPAQFYRGMPCTGGDHSLKQRLGSGRIESLKEPLGPNGLFNAWSTSMLKAEGTPPKSPGRCAEEDPGDACEHYLASYHEWSCMYCAGMAMDNNPATAWVEGAEGDGIGEAVLVKVDIARPVRIWAGFGRSEMVFRANNRPKKVAVYTLEGIGGAAQTYFEFADIKVIARRELELKDMNGYQPLPLPSGKVVSREQQHTFVAVEILSVYPGEKFKDTCISEINNGR